MKINDKIMEVFAEFDIPKDDGLCFLLATYFDLKPSTIPELAKSKVNAANILCEENGKIMWNIPLFDVPDIQEELPLNHFEWVKTEYVELFKTRNPEKGGNVRESMARMRKFFARNPEVRKKDVLEATWMYLCNTDPMYIRFPHYFIEKGSGADRISDLENWLDIRQEQLKIAEGKKENLTNTLQ